jgi:signal transduction histidine kinase
MANTLSTVLILIGVAVTAITMIMASYYYSYMESTLVAKAKSTSLIIANNGYQTEAAYREFAKQYVEGFEDRDRLALQFLTASGKVFLSSQGTGSSPGLAGFSLSTPDVKSALQGNIDTWSGKDPQTGERVMAVSAPLIYDGTVRGVMRYVTSLSAVNRQITLMTLAVLAAGMIVFLIVLFSNMYFLKSIIEPVAKITETAKRIAAGSYGVQIEKRYNDEIGELADTINDMSLKISQSEKMKSEFISSVSHELRTPLTAITGWAETLMRGEVGSAEDVRKGMTIIASEAKRLTKMVEELLEFSRIEDGRFTLRIEPVDIKAELEDAVYTYREFFRKEGITLEYHDCDEEFPLIPGDPERLRQVFSNLLDNAAKHGGAGQRIITSIWGENGEVCIRIRDFGPGVPEDELPHIKAKFYKGSSKARGSGIGLAVCDEIVTRLNGRLDVENAEGGGFQATIHLPMSNQE